MVQYNLFPSADMILSLSRECGTEKWEANVRIDIKVDPPPSPPVRIKRHAPLDTHNEKYMKQLKPKPCKDFIQVRRRRRRSLFSSVLPAGVTLYFHCIFSLQDNIRTVREESERLQKPKAAMFSLAVCGAEPPFMYSTHTFKSREQVKEILRHHLAQVCWMLNGLCVQLHFMVA